MADIANNDQTARVNKSNKRNEAALRLLVMPVEELRSMAAVLDENDPVAVAKARHAAKQKVVEKNAPGQPTTESEPGQATNVNEDPFGALSSGGRLIEPPFNMLSLATLPEQNTELTPIIETMEQNIEGFGHVLQPRVDMKLVPEEKREEFETALNKERVRLVNFFNYANLRISLTELRKRTRKDLEATGNAFWEVIRNAAGEIQGFEHVPAYQTRLSKQDEEPTKVDWPVLELQEDGSWQVEKVPAWMKFRRYAQSRLTPIRGLVQVAQGGYKIRWFKDFGDPRQYSNRTGNLLKTAEQVAAHRQKHGEHAFANELIHFKLYSCRSPYGLPRYIGNLLSIFGARAAEEINYVTFRNNNVPSMAVLVSNGQLTDGTLQRITSYVESQIQGSDNYSKFLVIEAEGDVEGEDGGHVKLDIKPLTQLQARDAMFTNYLTQNQAAIRRAFRIPPVFIGQSDDYTRSTAETSRRLADEQVFAPERNAFDEFVNRTLFPFMGISLHRFKSNSPNTTDNQQLVKMLGGAEKTGAMTPEIARLVMSDILGQELPDFPEKVEGFDFDPKLPFSLIMARAVQNRADPAEPGQQVTALKVLEKHLADVHGEDFDDDTLEELLMPYLTRLRKKLERDLEASVSESIDDGTL